MILSCCETQTVNPNFASYCQFPIHVNFSFLRGYKVTVSGITGYALVEQKYAIFDHGRELQHKFSVINIPIFRNYQTSFIRQYHVIIYTQLLLMHIKLSNTHIKSEMPRAETSTQFPGQTCGEITDDDKCNLVNKNNYFQYLFYFKSVLSLYPGVWFMGVHYWFG